jgi:hypothetical protein
MSPLPGAGNFLGSTGLSTILVSTSKPVKVTAFIPLSLQSPNERPGRSPAEARRVPAPQTARRLAPAAGGYTPAQRWIVSFEDGTSCFVKSAAALPGSPMDEWLRTEHTVYTQLKASFLPRLLAWEDDGAQPILILEDLSHAHWPPPWTYGQVESILDTLTTVRASRVAGIPPAPIRDPDLTSHWSEVQDDPEPLLSLGLCSRNWLDASLLTLIEAALRADLSGDDLVHFDVRSDNAASTAIVRSSSTGTSSHAETARSTSLAGPQASLGGRPATRKHPARCAPVGRGHQWLLRLLRRAAIAASSATSA